MSSKEVGTLRTRLSWEDQGATRSLEGFRRDLRGLRTEMTAAQSKGKEYANSMKGLSQQSDILTRRMRTQREQVRELRRRYEEARRVKGENATQTRNLANQYNNAVAAMRRTEQQLKAVNAQLRQQQNPLLRLSKNAEELGTKMQTFGRGMTSFGRSWSMYVTAPLVGAGAAALKVGMDFEEGLSKVQALTGATGSEMERLKEQAKEMGETTRYSATEAAEAMAFLGMAGWETQDIMAGMPGLLSLAASANMELGRAADITSNIMSGFNIEAAKAGQVADILAHAASSANTDVNQLGEAMKYLAPAANTLGMSIEDAVAAMMGVADAGLQGSMGGRAFATSLTRLAAPTSAMQKEMDRLKISFFDSQGAMKPMPDIIAELEKATEGMDEKTKAATLSTLFGAEAQKHWSVLLEQGSKQLAKNSKELENSEGAAKRMADTMSDNARGSLREFRSALEGAGIAISEHMIPAFTELVKKATEVVRQFGDLDDKTQQNIIKWGMFVAAVGPAAVGLGHLTTAMGGVTRLVGFLAGALGKSKGAGLLGRLGLMGVTGGPVGIAIAGVGALGLAIWDWNRRTEKAKEVNLDLANSLSEQASTLEETVKRYDELREKSGLSADEIGRLLDIQQELASTTDTKKIQELEKAYEEIAKQSGLSKDEIKELLDANNKIIEQAPNVEKAFSDKGNAVVENTEKVNEYISSLRSMALEELQIERIKALENEKELRNEIRELNEQVAAEEQKRNDLLELYNQHGQNEERTKAAIQERMAEINELIRERNLQGEATIDLVEEQEYLQGLLNGSIGESLGYHQDVINTLNDDIAKREEQLTVVDEIDSSISELLLKELEINAAGEEGLKIAQKQLEELKKQREEIKERLTKEQDIDGELQRQLQNLDQSIAKHERIIDAIEKETDLTSEVNDNIRKQETAARHVNDVLTTQNDYMNKVNESQKRTNKSIDDGKGKAESMNKELGKKVDKEVKVDDKGTAKKVQDEAEKKAVKPVTLSATWTNVTSGLRAALSNFSFPGFAKGTDYHLGGPFIAGEEGWELGRMGNRWEILGPGLYSRPAGYQVFTHDESKRIMQAMQNMPGYATGARPPGEADRVVNSLNNHGAMQDANTQVVALLRDIANGIKQGRVIQIDGQEITQVVNENNAVADVGKYF